MTVVKKYAIIGCGGIGYRLAEELLRYIIPEGNAELYLVDGKDVRAKNLERQFGLHEVGTNKAEALANLISNRLLNEDTTVRVIAVPHYFEDALISQHADWYVDGVTVFSGVDNKPSRVYIDDMMAALNDVVYISAGNAEVDGQADLFIQRNRRPIEPFHKLPSEIHPDLQEFDDGRMPSEIPCDEAVQSEPQLAFANMGAAWTALSLWYGQVLNEPASGRQFNEATFSIAVPHVSPCLAAAPDDRQFASV